MPVALLLILMASSVAILMSRQVTQAGSSVLLDGLSNQGLYAAETGAQLGAHQLFFPLDSRQNTDNQCLALAINQVFPIQGLSQCALIVSCGCTYENGNPCNPGQVGNYNGASGIAHSYYYIDSVAQCGSGVSAVRNTATILLQYP